MNEDEALARSWDDNAANWTRVVRDGLIPSRRAGTDEAVLRAIVKHGPRRLLDIGCGEGWLIRAAAERMGCAAVGIDGAAALIAAARAADPVGTYLTMDYDSFAANAVDAVGTGFDLIVCNYSLFAEHTTLLLRAAATRLAPAGAIVIQTLHPGTAAPGQDRWQIEDFSAFEGGGWTPMPWYFRSLDSWRAILIEAGLSLRDVQEPMADGRILSMLMVCGRG